MAKTASVAFEVPGKGPSLSEYENEVKQALRRMGAGPGEAAQRVDKSRTYVEGAHRAGIEPHTAAAVLYHKHCEAPGVVAGEARECGGAACPTEGEGDPSAMGLVSVKGERTERVEAVRLVSVAGEAQERGCGPFTKVVRDEEKFAACQRRAKGPLDTDHKMAEFLRGEMGKEDQEVFVVVGLDLHRKLRSYTEVARGQRERVQVRVEDILRPVIIEGPHGFVVAHNHPSGSTEPSDADRRLTKEIAHAAKIACPSTVFLDHLIIGVGGYYSFGDKRAKRF
jgi:DNA repair protein RadC